MSLTMIFVGVGVVAVLLITLVFMKSRQVDLTSGKVGEKPVWMRTTPPAETLAALKADGEKMTLYDHDEGEKIAAPFAEQIEDILRAKIKSDPALQQYEVDFGTGANGDLEIWVDGKKYDSVDQLPSEGLKRIFREAVKDWGKK